MQSNIEVFVSLGISVGKVFLVDANELVLCYITVGGGTGDRFLPDTRPFLYTAVTKCRPSTTSKGLVHWNSVIIPCVGRSDALSR